MDYWRNLFQIVITPFNENESQAGFNFKYVIHTQSQPGCMFWSGNRSDHEHLGGSGDRKNRDIASNQRRKGFHEGSSEILEILWDLMR